MLAYTLFIFAGCPFHATAQIPQAAPLRFLEIHPETTRLEIGRGTDVWEDKTNTLTIDDIHANPSLHWTHVASEKPSYGFTRSTYWFRFAVRNTAPTTTQWFLELDYAPLDSVTFYYAPLNTVPYQLLPPDSTPNGLPSGQTKLFQQTATNLSSDVTVSDVGEHWTVIETGDHFPFGHRIVPHRNFVVPLTFLDSVPRVFYVRIKTESSLQVPLALMRSEEFAHANTLIDLFYGGLFGTMATLVALNIVLFFTMRVSSYLLFVLYMTATGWYYAATAGYAQFLTGDFPRFTNTSTLVALFLSFGSLAFFGRLFLQTFRTAPMLDKVHIVVSVFGGVGAIAAILLPYSVVVRTGVVFVLIGTILCFVSGIVILRRGNRSAAYFLIALGAFLIGSLTGVLRNVGILSSNVFTVHSVEIASGIEGVLFSFGLAGQYRWLKKQKEDAQREALRLQQEANTRLEEKVRQRTQALAESNEEIQRQLAILDEQSREIELANTTLNEKNIQLEELNREKNEFLGIAAHDLKNPLSSITMSASIVLSYRDKITEEQLQERLENIMGTASRMMEIIKNLLDVNAIESGQFNFTVERVNVAEIAQMLVKEYQERAAAKNISLWYEQNTHSASGFVPEAMGDRLALIEALENLISNAVKYSPRGKNIYVRMQRSDSPLAIGHSSGDKDSTNASITNAFLRVEVQDEGPGISEEDMKKLFGKFARLSARPTGGEHSTGLGLSIVKKMVEAMQGRVWCESELGKGATFIVELPQA
jgi:signal transduction histidine kinase